MAVEVLVTLSEGANHGYAIKRRIEERVGGDFVLGSGSLYQALQRLERRGLIAETRAASGDPRRGRVYKIQPDGKDVLAAELGRMARLLRHAKRHQLAIRSGRVS